MNRYHCALLIGLAACSSETIGDGRDDSFAADGKSDAALSEGSRGARGVLAVANSLSEQELDDAVGLDARAAKNIAAARSVSTIATLADLDGVPYVGPIAFDKLLAYATDNGFLDASAKYEAVWSIASNDVWAVGTEGLVEHWDGTAWQTVATGVTTRLWDVWASGPNDVWIVGDNATALRWNGSSLAKVTLPAGADDDIYSVRGSARDHVWFAGTKGTWGSTTYRWDGSQFSEPGRQCQGGAFTLHVVSATEVYVGGDQESICHYDGTRWHDISPYQTGYPVGVSDIWAATSGTLYALVGGDVFRRPAGASWSKMYSVPYHDDESWSDLRRFAAFSETDLWVTGANGHAVHWDGSTWTLMHADRRSDYFGIAGTSSSDLWTVGYDARAHFDGTAWTVSLAP